jgi:glycogen operon protein
MHVDGFRFDLLSALTRTGTASTCAPPADRDRPGPVLRHVKLIAEPWDASIDGYRVGEFPPPWIEWNDQFRDEIRDFWTAAPPGIRVGRDPARGLRRPLRRRRALAVRLGQLRHRARRLHVRDLVSYDHKHNEANGEATATAPTTTGPGTTASRARPTSRGSWRCGAGRRPT